MLLGNSRNRFEIFVGFLCVVRFLVGNGLMVIQPGVWLFRYDVMYL